MEHLAPLLLELLKRPCIVVWSSTMIMIGLGWMVKMAIRPDLGAQRSRVALATCIMLSIAISLSDIILSTTAVYNGEELVADAATNWLVGMGAMIVLGFIVIQCVQTVWWITAKSK